MSRNGGGVLGRQHRLASGHRQQDTGYHQDTASFARIAEALQDANLTLLADAQRNALHQMLRESRSNTFWHPQIPEDETIPHYTRLIAFIGTLTRNENAQYAAALAFAHVHADHLETQSNGWSDLATPHTWELMMQDVLADLYAYRHAFKNPEAFERRSFNF